jgi:single-stranded-DNA-specific exonuclease
MQHRTWVLRPVPDACLPAGRASQAFAGDSDASPLLRRLLCQRGILTPDAARRFLRPRLEDLRPPTEYTDMEKAVARIRLAAERRERVLIYGDYDVDGVTGSAMVFLALREAGIEADVFLPDRLKTGYGLKRAGLDRALRPDTKLVIAVDNGLSGAEEVDYLNAKGIDVLIVDHHEPKDRLPRALALITPQRRASPEEKESLAACGLAWKLAWGLLGRMEDVRRHLDIVALGTVADMAPLTGENRVLVKFGLEELGRTGKKGLKALVDVVRLRGARVTSTDAAFLLGPRINAAGRVGSAENALRLLVTDEALEAENLARLLDEGNRQRQKLEDDAFREAVHRVESEHHFGREHVIVLADARWHEGIVGILANRLVERFHRPAFAIALRDGVGRGSGRSIPRFYLFDNLRRCPDVFRSFGGHRYACGLVIEEGRIPEFREAINAVARESLAAEDLVPSVTVDAELELEELDGPALEELELLEPFGPGNPRPLFTTRGLRVKTEPRPLGRNGCSFWVEGPRGAVAEAVLFRRRFEAARGEALDAVYEAGLVRRGGISTIRLRLEDARRPD